MRRGSLLPRLDTSQHDWLAACQSAWLAKVNIWCRATAATHRWYLMTCDHGSPSAILSCTAQELSGQHERSCYSSRVDTRQSTVPSAHAAKPWVVPTRSPMASAPRSCERMARRAACVQNSRLAGLPPSVLASVKMSTIYTEVIMSQQHSAHLLACRRSQAALTRTRASTTAPR